MLSTKFKVRAWLGSCYVLGLIKFKAEIGLGLGPEPVPALELMSIARLSLEVAAESK